MVFHSSSSSSFFILHRLVGLPPMYEIVLHLLLKFGQLVLFLLGILLLLVLAYPLVLERLLGSHTLVGVDNEQTRDEVLGV